MNCVYPISDHAIARNFLASPLSDLRGVCLLICEDDDHPIVRPLIEVSPLECKFSSPSPVPRGTTLRLMFIRSETREFQSQPATVHWCRHVKNCWQIGVVLSEPLPLAFAAAMGMDQRLYLRYEVNADILVRVDGRERVIESRLRDYSLKGISFHCRETPRLAGGASIELIQLNRTTPGILASARVLWTLPDSPGYFCVGASIPENDGLWFMNLVVEDGVDA